MTIQASTFLNTVKTDLLAGESWLESEVIEAALEVWNIIKGVYVALAPAEMAQVVAFLKAELAVMGTDVAKGMSLEAIETALLTKAPAAVQDLLKAAGSAVVQQLIVGIVAAL